MTGKGLSREEVERMIQEAGGAKKIDQGLKQYRESCRRVSRRYRQLQREVPGKWVVFDYNAEVAVIAETLEQAQQKIDEGKLPRDEVIVRYIHPPGKEPIHIFKQTVQAA